MTKLSKDDFSNESFKFGNSKKIIQDQEEELILCTHDTIQHLKPEKYITENDKKNFYPQ